MRFRDRRVIARPILGGIADKVAEQSSIAPSSDFRISPQYGFEGRGSDPEVGPGLRPLNPQSAIQAFGIATGNRTVMAVQPFASLAGSMVP